MIPRPLMHHPAGPFFALAGLIAVALPWLWLLPHENAAMAHPRLGIFGLAGAAVTGYVLTALPAWTGHRPPLPLSALLLLWVLARIAGLVAPWSVLPSMLLQGVLGLAILWPMVIGRAWHRVMLAAVPLVMAFAEYAAVTGILPPRGLVAGLGLLILLVGGRAVPAFLRAETAAGTGRPPRPLWPLALLWPAVLAGPAPVRLVVALALGAGILLRVAPARRAGSANRMLALGWGTLAPAALALALAEAGPEAQAADHLLLMGTMGGTVLAFAARAAMRRSDDGRPMPHRLHWPALWLVLAAAPLRGIAALTAGTGAGPVWLALSGTAWSLGWAAFLIVHLAALPRPAPFPVLSGVRRPQTGQTTKPPATPSGR